MRVLGIDPGTSSWGFVFLEDGKIAEEKSIPTEQIKNSPDAVLDLAKRAQLTIAPSGYGTVLKRVTELSGGDFFEILLKRKDEKTVMGLEKVLRKFKENSLNAYVIPGVKLLPTVMDGWKVNKIDMGTPDKLCAAVAGIVDQSRRLKLHYNQTNFILMETGFAFDAFIAVNGGQIVDGIGGTMASSTWRGEDGEILYLKGKVSKEELRRGVVDLKVLEEGITKDIGKLHTYAPPKEILLSGSRSRYFIDFLNSKFKNARLLETCESSNAAYGAAIIADGLAGGRFKELVNLLRIKEAKGSNLDYTDLKHGDN